MSDSTPPPEPKSKFQLMMEAEQLREFNKKTLEFLVGQGIDKAAKSKFAVMLKATRMPMKDPGMDRPFMTSHKRQAEEVCRGACAAGYPCVVVTVHELIQHMMNEMGKSLKNN